MPERAQGKGPEQNSPVKSPYFTVQYYEPKIDNGQIVGLNPNPFLTKKIRMMTDLTDAGIAAQRITGQRGSISAMWDSSGNQVGEADQKAVWEELLRRQDEFAKKANPEDWEKRSMGIEFESILDGTFMPDRNYTGLGIHVSSSSVVDILRREKSEVLERFVARALKILSKSQTTLSFQEAVLDRLKLSYKFGVSALGLIDLKSIGIDLENNQFDLFDPEKTEQIERTIYESQQMVAGQVFLPQMVKELTDKNEKWRNEFRERYKKDL